MMADLWRTGKSRLVRNIINAKNESERLALKPDCIKSDVEWRAFVAQKTSKEHLVRTIIYEVTNDSFIFVSVNLSLIFASFIYLLNRILGPNSKRTERKLLHTP